MEVQWLFLRLIAIVYFWAFLSLHVQVIGIFGKRGFLPLGYSDTLLHAGTIAGMLSSIGAFVGYYPFPFLCLSWILYLLYNLASRYHTLGNHWDNLLLEMGLYSIFYSLVSPPPYLMTLVFPFLLFRFLLGAGLHKLIHPDRCDEWRSLTTLSYFFETEPMPNRISYYCHKAPLWVSRLFTLVTLVVFFVGPLLIFTPYSYLAFIIIVSMQIGIWVTGNFPWINPLVIILSLTIIDIPPIFPLGVTLQLTPFLNGFVTLIAACLLFLNALRLLCDAFPKFEPLLKPLVPWRIASQYNLFRYIINERYEIIVEGSLDGQKWTTYEFKYKPGDVNRPPAQITPHQPRLDWNMWEASWLPFSSQQGWFVPFLGCLLEGVPEVLNLLDKNPFPDKPPKYIRALLYHYRFSDLETKKKTGQWWVREFLRPFGSIYTLKDTRFPFRKTVNRRPIKVKPDFYNNLKETR